MQKSLSSKALLSTKYAVKKSFRFFACLCAPKKSYALFGLPSGLTKEMEGQKYTVALLDETVHSAAHTLEPSCHPVLQKCDPIEGVGIYELHQGMATDTGGQLTSSNRLVDTYLQSIDQKKAYQHNLFRVSTARFRPKIYTSDQPVVTLSTGWQGAFYHWLHEVLPRLAIYKKAGIDLSRIFVEVHTAFQKECLELLDIDLKRIINAYDYQAVRAPTIYASSVLSRPTTWSCHFLRTSMQPHLVKDKKLPKRLYISRKDANKRRVLNEDALVPMLKSYGFEEIVLTSYSFKEQMNFFYNAEMIVTPHGAGLSHLAFAEKGMKLLELFAEPYVIPCYWQLANVMGVQYHYLFSEPREDVNPIDPDLVMDVQKVERLIQSW